MRGSQFLMLINMLRDELRRSTDPAVSSSDVDGLKRVLNRNYEFLYTDYDWPFLRVVFNSDPMLSGEYLYDFHTLDPERIEKVAVWHNGVACPITRGIGFEQYSQFDTEDGERSSPVQFWDMRSVDNHVMYEVWPVPDDTTQYIQFIGWRQFVRLVNDIDQCMLDDNLVVAFSAAELLLAQGSADAESKLRSAQALYSRLRGRIKGASRTYALTEGGMNKPAPTVVVQVNG